MFTHFNRWAALRASRAFGPHHHSRAAGDEPLPYVYLPPLAAPVAAVWPGARPVAGCGLRAVGGHESRPYEHPSCASTLAVMSLVWPPSFIGKT